MKNRYGMDGHTYSVDADTSTGHFSVHKFQYSQEEEEVGMVSNRRSNEYDTDTTPQQKNQMYDKFQQFSI